jgi:hypothetical protein
MSNIFYIRDNFYKGEIHRVSYNHEEQDATIIDHEDPTYEAACREIGYDIDSACLDFEEIVRGHSITKALTSIKVFPGTILIRIAAAWAKAMAMRFDEYADVEILLADGTPMTLTIILSRMPKYLERYLDSSKPWPVHDENYDYPVEDDISSLVPTDAFWQLEDRYRNDDVAVCTLRAVQDLVMACGWYLPIGPQANKSEEVEEKVASSVGYTLSATNRRFKLLQKTEHISELEIAFRKAALFNRMLRDAAAITKKYQKEL